MFRERVDVDNLRRARRPPQRAHDPQLLVVFEHEAVVMVPETPALKEADTSSTVAFTAHAGLHGDVMATETTPNGELLRVRFENGLEAWLKRTDVAVLE